MALSTTSNTILSNYIINGSKEYVMRISIVGNGSGDETNTWVNVSPFDLMNQPNSNTSYQNSPYLNGDCRVMSIDGSLTGFSMSLAFEGMENDILFYQHFAQIPSDIPTHLHWHKIGGIKDNAIGATGNIVMTTSGLGVNCSGDLVIRIRKH